MDLKLLAQLMKDLGSDRVERKASFTDKAKIRQAICAFSNDLPNHRAPGYVFIGLNDDGSCAGLSITDELLLTLSNLRDEGNIRYDGRFGAGIAIARKETERNGNAPPEFSVEDNFVLATVRRRG